VLRLNRYGLLRNTKNYAECERILADGLNRDAKEKGMETVLPFSISIENEEGKIVAGATGYSIFGDLFTDMLWVEKEIRDQGWGTKIMQEAEAIGKERGCTFATVNTMSWQALPFYEKLGYEIEFVREGYAKDSKRYFFRKQL